MKKYQEFEERLKKISYLGAASALLSWDQEVFMPSGASEHRAQTLSTLSSIIHKEFTDPHFANLPMQICRKRKQE
jgi:carboxypeptidase Taq